jgi:hypothetical protein
VGPGGIFLLGLLSACTGLVTTPGGSPSASGGADPGVIDPGPGAGAGGATGAAACVPGDPPATTRFFRLTHAQYDNAILALTGLDLHASAGFPVDQNQAGFDRGMDLEIGDALGKALRSSAEAIAAQVVATPAAYRKVLGCDPAGGSACAATFISTFGRHAYRRPLGDGEQAAYLKLFTAGGSLVDGSSDAFRNGVQTAIQAFLQSPNFLYRVELTTTPSGTLLALSGYELASRLSLFLQNGPPDDALLDAAAAGQLGGALAVADQARRLVGTPAAEETVRDFHHQWLLMDLYPNKLAKDPTLYPTVTPALAPVLVAETERFVGDVIFGLGKGFGTLMTAPFTYVNQTTAPLYGVAGTFGDSLQRVDLDPAERAGLLTQLGFLAVNAYSNQSSPIHRGAFVQRRVLCATIPDPPPNVPQLPGLGSAQTTRQEVDLHTAPDACAGCHHALINPVGFGFEGYDAVGRYRTTENGFPIDATGVLAGTAAAAAGQASFAGAVEESRLIAAAPEAQSCYARTWVRYALGRAETAGDSCAIATLAANLASDDYRITDLLIDLTRTKAFLYRAPGGP